MNNTPNAFQSFAKFHFIYVIRKFNSKRILYCLRIFSICTFIDWQTTAEFDDS